MSNKKFNKKFNYLDDLSEASDCKNSENIFNGSNIDKNLSKKIINNDKETDIKNIAVKRINDEYYHGKYGDLDVIMNNDGFVNVTKLCNEAVTKNGEKKIFKDWVTTLEAKELMDELSKITGIPTTQLLVQNLTSSENITRGTYAHPDLVPLIASWASPKFGVRVSKIVNEYFAKEMFDKHQDLIKKKDDKIDRLSKKIDKQTKIMEDQSKTMKKQNETMKKQSETMKKQDETMKKQDDKIKKLLSQGNEVLGYAKDTNRKLNIVVDERAPRSEDPQDQEKLILIKNNDEQDESDDEDVWEYAVMNLMKKSVSSRLSAHRNKHPNMEIIMTIKYTPNSKNLWHKLKKKLTTKGKIIINRNTCLFNLDEDFSEQQLKQMIKKIHESRKNHRDL
ncbi:putative KilA-N domain-containing protein [Cotonvirus japonicus]|uniref:KilA-N domain-containing protein n=1 Tax=Cotonvirus japonicus TaxID=2811091 RepID=A0ABM7NQU2_9VIRU|nr:putative KilA-N domain-containing protein [Cotonvirus japonicus]BCS82504.1 putative KilA-N domain-containing protein [Cotonvirus japonicus]